jgi:hypothetical protein
MGFLYSLKPKNMKTAVVVAVLAAIGLGFFFHFSSTPKSYLAEKEKCSQDGAKWIAQHYPEKPGINIVDVKGYAYSPQLDTCLVNFDYDVEPNISIEEDVYDIYGNKIVASVSHNFVASTTQGDYNTYAAAVAKYFAQ